MRSLVTLLRTDLCQTTWCGTNMEMSGTGLWCSPPPPHTHTSIQVSLEALLPHKWVRGTVHHRRCGDLHLEGRCHLWTTSVEGTITSTYNFHATHGKTSLCKNRFRMFTWLLRIPNTFIYMSFRAAQDRNKVVGRDMTSSMPYSTWREDPVATTWHHSSVFLSLAIVLGLFSLVVNYIVLSYRTSLVVNYIYCVAVVWYILYSLPILEAPCLGRLPKQAIVNRQI
jgi:hypothetical protein